MEWVVLGSSQEVEKGVLYFSNFFTQVHLGGKG
jgi:hypothetical protein